METKGNYESMARLARRLGYRDVEFIKARGLVRGQILMECLWKTDRIFCCLMKNEFILVSARNFLVVIVPYTIGKKKRNFWNCLEELILGENQPKLLCGDFNEIVDKIEKLGEHELRHTHLFLK